MPLNPKVAITETGIHGHCWFAKADFARGEWIWKKRPDGELRVVSRPLGSALGGAVLRCATPPSTAAAWYSRRATLAV